MERTPSATMAYACVYRHPIPRPIDRARTSVSATGIPLLQRYLDAYDSEGCFYDWGDDPSFFAAMEVFGTSAAATWGVCRPDVRKRLEPGDFAAFFCARQLPDKRWAYFFVGVGTVAERLQRADVWAGEAPYSRFFNLLARPIDGVLEQQETIHKFHDDWKTRIEAPYLVFDSGSSRFDLHSPLHVATYGPGGDGREIWNLGDERVAALAELVLPDDRGPRRLRSVSTQYPHPKLPLRDQAKRVGGFDQLRTALLGFVAEQRLPEP